MNWTFFSSQHCVSRIIVKWLSAVSIHMDTDIHPIRSTHSTFFSLSLINLFGLKMFVCVWLLLLLVLNKQEAQMSVLPLSVSQKTARDWTPIKHLTKCTKCFAAVYFHSFYVQLFIQVTNLCAWIFSIKRQKMWWKWRFSKLHHRVLIWSYTLEKSRLDLMWGQQINLQHIIMRDFDNWKEEHC